MDILQEMIAIDAIKINLAQPFIWTSGIHAPIYCDNRKTIGHYALRHAIAKQLSEKITEKYPDVEIIGGMATAGIPHATSVADLLQLPLVYFRSKPKGHGMASAIEGDFEAGKKIVLIEDLISTGGSVLKGVTYAQAADLNVLGVISIFNYELQVAQEQFTQAAVRYESLYTFTDLSKKISLNEKEQAFIEKWKENPKNEKIWQ